MARSSIPKYRRQRRPKGKDAAFVEVNGCRTYFPGAYGSAESKQAYGRAIAELQSHGGRPPAPIDKITIVEVLAAYWRHAQAYYVKDGRPTSEVESLRQALRPVRRLYGQLPASQFSPLKLKTVRQAYIDADYCRTTVNRHTQRIKQAFKWAVENEYIPPAVYHGLQAVVGIRKGRSEVRESAPVRPVPNEFVEAIEPYVSRQVWAIVRLQQLSGMRSGEVVIMRGRDLDTSGKLWLYRPESHKCEHHNIDRSVEIGPRAQAVIRPFLKADLGAFLFSPKDAVTEWLAGKREQRKTRVQPSQRDRSKPHPRRTPADRYSRDSYRRAIQRACDVADWETKRARELPADSDRIIPRWHPHQLRHNYGTMIRRQFGIESARIMLGHRSVPMAELYSEVDRGKAREIVEKIG